MVSRFLAAAVLFVTAAALPAAARWASIGPLGGSVEFVAVSPANPAIIYASSRVGGVFVSGDAGATWRAANVGITDIRIQCLAVSPLDANVAYAGSQTGGFETTDGGATWTALGGGFPAALITAIVIAPESASTMYAVGTDGAVVRSTDAGATWTSLANSTVSGGQPRTIAVDPSHPNTLYLGTLQGGFFRSTDGGSSWSAENSGLTDAFGNINSVVVIAVDPTNPSKIFAGTAGNGVFVSSDGGSNWTVFNVGTAASFVTGIAFSPDGTAYMTGQLYFSVLPPGAPAWTIVSLGSVQFLNSLAIGPGNDPAVYVGYGRLPIALGGFVALEGGALRYSSIAALVVTSLAADPVTTGRTLAATTLGSFAYSGGAWSPLPLQSGGSATTLPPLSLFFDPRTSGLLYAGAGGRTYTSRDGGATIAQSGVVGDPNQALAIVRCFLPQPGSAQGIFAGTSKGLFASADQGATWSPASADLAARVIFALASDPASSSTLWAGTDDGVYRSTDGGAHWAKVSTAPGGNVHAVLVAAGSGRILAGADSGLFASTDGGATWAPAAGVGATVDALARDSTSGTLAAGTTAGVFVSGDGGASWAASNDGLANDNVFCLAYSGGTLLAGTNGGSVFQRIETAPREPVARPAGPSTPRALPPRG